MYISCWSWAKKQVSYSPAGLLHPVCLYRLYSTTLSPIIKIEISVISHWGVGKGLHTGKKKWRSLFFFLVCVLMSTFGHTKGAVPDL